MHLAPGVLALVTTFAPITFPYLENTVFKSVARVLEESPEIHKLRELEGAFFLSSVFSSFLSSLLLTSIFFSPSPLSSSSFLSSDSLFIPSPESWLATLFSSGCTNIELLSEGAFPPLELRLMVSLLVKGCLTGAVSGLGGEAWTTPFTPQSLFSDSSSNKLSSSPIIIFSESSLSSLPSCPSVSS